MILNLIHLISGKKISDSIKKEEYVNKIEDMHQWTKINSNYLFGG